MTDRGVAMIQLPAWSRTLDWRMHKKNMTPMEHYVQRVPLECRSS
eukprot:CAMPEP_0174363484 /NCGR_PEP_ID=MMETSP0811_2-20130205/69009_1 /TAXON_ID=73025 ORGANISM="Eutreptiella gymnastica-like, Strain CCMP1594" /NCGR_SAMPLE_ID=MMETSP0811_2 /ASSEMBLY_ACC=CAM_ASM_000667 /LENGTH=44 /DNA_ID= /DNA_START= /DNA_END= /DNA_ORIENTATION=